MNKKLIMLTLSLLSLSFVACGKGGNDEPGNPPVDPAGSSELPFDTARYVGTLTVDGQTFDNISCKLIKASGSTLNMLIDEMKFSDAVPVAVSVEADGIGYEANEQGGFNLNGDHVSVKLGGEPAEMVQISGLEGWISGNSLYVSFSMMGIPVTYQAEYTSENQKEEQPENPSEYGLDAIGTLSVDYNGATYDTKNYVAHVDFTSGSKLNLVLNQVKFVPDMPVTLDVVVPALDVETEDLVVSFSGTNVIPMVGATEFPRYLVDEIQGRIEGGVLTFSLNFGSYPTRFTGRVQL